MEGEHKFDTRWGFGLPHIEWLPDETLYSRCARMHRMFCHAQSRATTLLLFGHSRAGAQHDFPTRIADLISRSGGMFGYDASELIRRRTVLRFFFPWLSEQRRALSVQACQAGSVLLVKSSLGVAATGERSHLSLKYCVRCVESDLSVFGIDYWHLSHQLPAVWMCMQHEERLRAADTTATYSAGKGIWQLPSDAMRNDGVSLMQTEREHSSRVRNLARISMALSELPDDFTVDFDRLKRTYQLATKGRGIDSQNSNRLAKSFFEYWTHVLDGLQESAKRQKSSRQSLNARHLHQALMNPRTGTNPLYHVVLIEWLFHDWETFWGVYQSRSRQAEMSSQQATDSSKFPFKEVKSTGSKGPSALNISIQRLAQEHCALRRSVTSELRAGFQREEISIKRGVPIGEVNAILNSVASLRSEWRSANHEANRMRSRFEWLFLAQQYPNLGEAELGRREPALYAWLCHWDRQWLDNVETRLFAIESLCGLRQLSIEPRYVLSKRIHAIAIGIAAMDVPSQSAGGHNSESESAEMANQTRLSVFREELKYIKSDSVDQDRLSQ